MTFMRESLVSLTGFKSALPILASEQFLEWLKWKKNSTMPWFWKQNKDFKDKTTMLAKKGANK